MTGPACAAAWKAGWSARRRSRRSQTICGLVMRLAERTRRADVPAHMSDGQIQPERDAAISVPLRGYRIDPTKALVVAAICWVMFALVVIAVHANRTTVFDDYFLNVWREGPNK